MPCRSQQCNPASSNGKARHKEGLSETNLSPHRHNGPPLQRSSAGRSHSTGYSHSGAAKAHSPVAVHSPLRSESCEVRKDIHLLSTSVNWQVPPPCCPPAQHQMPSPAGGRRNDANLAPRPSAPGSKHHDSLCQVQRGWHESVQTRNGSRTAHLPVTLVPRRHMASLWLWSCTGSSTHCQICSTSLVHNK